MSFELLFWSLSNLTLRMNSCVHMSCCCCIFSVQPISSIVCFFVVIALTHGVHSHLQSSTRASTSCRFCFVPNFSQCKNCPLMRSRHKQHKYVHPTLYWFVSPDTAGISEIYPLWICNHFLCLLGCIVSYEMNSLPLSCSVSCSVRKSLLYYIVRD